MNNREDDFDNTKQWALKQWGEAYLGDKRRAKSAVRLGEAMANNPSGSLPTQTQTWGDLKSAYLLLNEEEVSHSALLSPHSQETHQQAILSQAEVVLQIQDTTELDYTNHHRVSGLGRIGNNHGRGFLVHSCLTVIPKQEELQILGVAAQKVWTRPEKVFKRNETRRERDQRPKESDVWAEIIEQIGPSPANGVQFVSVGDRGSDIFSYVRRALAARWQVLLRVTQNRLIIRPDGERDKLLNYSRSLSESTTKKLNLRGRDGKPKREVELKISYSEVMLQAPQNGSERHEKAVRGWVVRCWAEKDEKGEAIEWILFTTLEVATHEQALKVTQWYSNRWLIEEYHKCLKTGCQIESSQLQSAQGLKNLLGFTAVVAIRLLQLREKSRQRPEVKAVAEVSPELIQALIWKLGWKKELEEIRLREFWRAVAGLGGFIGRKSDGDPGWQTLWKGWQRLQDLAWGLQMKT